MVSGGFNVVDFMSLPAIERSVVRLIMRHVNVTYPQLCEAVATLPIEKRIDQSRLNSALAHLIRTRWLIQQVDEQRVIYRVNTLGRPGSQNQDLWDSLDLENMPQPKSMPAPVAPINRGTKRVLPNKIWDSLIEPSDQNEAPVAAKPARRTNLFDKLIDDDDQKSSD